ERKSYNVASEKLRAFSDALSERNDHQRRMFPLTPALSLKGEGAVCAGIILWETLSPRRVKKIFRLTLFFKQFRRPWPRVYLHKGRTLKAGLKRPGHRTVENRFAGDPVATNGGAVVRGLRRIELVSADPRQMGDADIALHTGGHRPQDVVAVENIHIFVDENNVFKLGIGG